MPRWLRVIGTGAGFLTFAVGSSVYSWGILPVATLRSRGKSPAERVRIHQSLMLGGYRFFMNALKAYGVCHYTRPDPPERPEGAYVLVSNHPTLIDVMVMLGVVPNISCVVRANLFDVPFLGPLLTKCGHISGPRPGEDEGETPILDRIVARLEEGHPVLVFPEGSRSPAWGLRRFKRGAVEAALRARVPILPVFVSCDPPTLMKSQPWYDVPDRPFRLTVDFLPVIHPGSDDTSRGLTQDLAAVYRERVSAAEAANGSGGVGP